MPEKGQNSTTRPLDHKCRFIIFFICGGVVGCGVVAEKILGGWEALLLFVPQAGEARKEAKIIFTWYLVRPPTSSLHRCTVTSLYAVLHDATE